MWLLNAPCENYDLFRLKMGGGKKFSLPLIQNLIKIYADRNSEFVNQDN